MLVSSRVPLAFLRTDLAGVGADVQHLQEDSLVAAGSSRCQRAGGKTYIGAIQIQPDALPQLAGCRIGRACIGATQAMQDTVIAFLDAMDEGVAVLAPHCRMGFDDLPCVHVYPRHDGWTRSKGAPPQQVPASFVRQTTTRRRVQVSATHSCPTGSTLGPHRPRLGQVECRVRLAGRSDP